MEALLLKIVDIILNKIVGKKLEDLFPRLFPNKNKELIELFERRLKNKDENIEKEKKKLETYKSKKETERIHIVDSLKRRSIAIEKLIEKYDKPLNAILISYAAQKEEKKKNSFQTCHFIKEELSKYNAKYLGGTDSLIPPAKVPGWIKNEKDLSRWFKRSILKGRYCKLKFLILFDLKKKSFWGTFLPYTQKKPLHFSIGDKLSAKDLFTEEQIGTIALSDIINQGDIAWLASIVVSGEELEKIIMNQSSIEKELKYPTLRELAEGNVLSNLLKVLSKYIKQPETVAKKIIGEARFWHKKLHS